MAHPVEQVLVTTMIFCQKTIQDFFIRQVMKDEMGANFKMPRGALYIEAGLASTILLLNGFIDEFGIYWNR